MRAQVDSNILARNSAAGEEPHGRCSAPHPAGTGLDTHHSGELQQVLRAGWRGGMGLLSLALRPPRGRVLLGSRTHILVIPATSCFLSASTAFWKGIFTTFLCTLYMSFTGI